jgi:tRNA(Ile)-lysidine synthase
MKRYVKKAGGNTRMRPAKRSSPRPEFPQRLLAAWRRLKLPTTGSVVVAVSGGADSTALLLALDELIKAGKLNLNLIVAHLDHRLRKASSEDLKWVEQLATSLGYEIELRRINVRKRASKTSDNLEQAARRARYGFLGTIAKRRGAQLVLTAHTIDDQAETVLLRLLRGSAAEGLAGIEPVRLLEANLSALLARPLVTWACRADTEDYCRQRTIGFRVDEMNMDEKFTRVRIRKQLLPLMQSFNRRIVQALSRTAQLLQEDSAVLAGEANKLLELASRDSGKKSRELNMPLVSVDVIARAPAAVRRRALRTWIAKGRGDLRRLEMVHLLGVERLLEGDRGGRIAELPDGTRVVRRHDWLELQREKGLKKTTSKSKIVGGSKPPRS